MTGRGSRPGWRAAVRGRLVALATLGLGLPRVIAARRVLDRFGAADGGLLASGIAYNAVLALIPLALLATGIAGTFLGNSASRAALIRTLARIFPPLAGVFDEIVGGLATASPSISLIGLVLAAWGTSRLFAALESGMSQVDVAAGRRSFGRRTARRVVAIAILVVLVVSAVIAAPVVAIAVEAIDADRQALTPLALIVGLVPPVLGGLALAVAYRLVPIRRPSWHAVGLPAAVGAAALLVLTRLFVFLTPRIFGANVVYGTLGALLVSLTWLNLVFTIILIGSAWVGERAATEEDGAAA